MNYISVEEILGRETLPSVSSTRSGSPRRAVLRPSLGSPDRRDFGDFGDSEILIGLGFGQLRSLGDQQNSGAPRALTRSHRCNSA